MLADILMDFGKFLRSVALPLKRKWLLVHSPNNRALRGAHNLSNQFIKTIHIFFPLQDFYCYFIILVLYWSSPNTDALCTCTSIAITIYLITIMPLEIELENYGFFWCWMTCHKWAAGLIVFSILHHINLKVSFTENFCWKPHTYWLHEKGYNDF